MSKRSEDLKKRLRAVESQADNDYQATKAKETPPGWTPGLEWDGKGGEITTPALGEVPSSEDWSDLLRHYGLDPERHEVVEDTVRFTAWDGWHRPPEGGPAISKVQYAFKATIRLRNNAESPALEELYLETKKLPKVRKRGRKGENTEIILLSDWQTGYGGADGVEGLVKELAILPDKVAERIATARENYGSGGAVIAGMGDLYEQCANFYSYQSWEVELDHREQGKVVRRAIRDIVYAAAQETPELTVIAVGGNHGEQRTGGTNRRTTGRNDNDDVAVVESVAEIVEASGKFPNVAFRLPTDKLAISLPVSGQIVGFTHGHLAKYKSAGAIATMWDWWTSQAMGRYFPGIADSTILNSGHWHHSNMKEQDGRALFIAPSLVRASDYFGEEKGVITRPGTMVYTVAPDGWRNLDIL